MMRSDVGKQFYRVAHIDHDQKHRPAYIYRQCSGILFGLSASAEHRITPALGVANPVTVLEILGSRTENKFGLG